MDSYKTTFETWDKFALIYQNRFMDLDLYNDTYKLFCELIAKSSPDILEIGCGLGNITRYMQSLRPDFKITAIDVAPNMIKLAKANNPGVEFKIMDCTEIQTIEPKFDGIVCGFCIPYLAEADSSKLIKDCFRLLNKGGFLYISTIKGDYNQSGFQTGCTGDRCYIYYYDEHHFQKVLAENDFNLMGFIQKELHKDDGTYETNQIFIAQKN